MVAKLNVTVGAGHLQYEKRKLRAVMRAAGNEIAAVARSMVKSSGSGRKYYGPGGSTRYRGGYVKGVFQASSPGGPPAKVTGTLAASFKVRPFKSGEGVAIRDLVFYGLFLEAGAKGRGKRVLAPRPFLTAALAQREASIADRIRASIADDVKFVRQKP